jgi:hypothetical protein
LYLIAANDPFSMGKKEISRLLNINYEKIDDVVHKRQLINALEVKNNAYRIKFPVFLDRYVVNMEKYINNVGELIGKKIMSLELDIYEKIAISCYVVVIIIGVQCLPLIVLEMEMVQGGISLDFLELCKRVLMMQAHLIT